jgi:hypothetical protein
MGGFETRPYRVAVDAVVGTSPVQFDTRGGAA